MKNKLKLLKKLQEDVNTSYKNFRENFEKEKLKYNDALLDIFNFEGKYINSFFTCFYYDN